MDPSENLTEQLELAREIINNTGETKQDIEDFVDNAERLATLVLSLDFWIKNGGFLPTPWQQQLCDGK